MDKGIGKCEISDVRTKWWLSGYPLCHPDIELIAASAVVRLVSAAKAGVTGKQDNFYREQLNKHLYRDTVHRNPRDIERSASGIPDIRYKTFKIDSEYFNSYIFFSRGYSYFTCGGCLDSSPRVSHYRSQISLLSAICGASPGQPPWPRSSFLDVGDGHLLATRGAASATGESESVSARDTPWSE